MAGKIQKIKFKNKEANLEQRVIQLHFLKLKIPPAPSNRPSQKNGGKRNSKNKETNLEKRKNPKNL